MRAYSKAYRRRHEPVVDALPEQMNYHDTGCEVSSSCLACPLPQCKFDDPLWYQQLRRQGRDFQILEAHAQEGATVFVLAERFRVSPRTIHRALRRVAAPAALSA
jgi:hypothetical protein